MSLPGRASKDVADLCPCIRAKYRAFQLEAKSQAIEVVLIETLRDAERQRFYVDHGTSQTMFSYHIAHPPNAQSLAFDVCPREYLPMKNWNPGGSSWGRLGSIGEALGLEWGGNWSGWKDRAHFNNKSRQCDCLPRVSA